MYHFYIFSGSNYDAVTQTGSKWSFAPARQDWNFVVEDSKLYLKYTGIFLLGSKFPGISGKLKDVKEYKITDKGLQELNNELRLNLALYNHLDPNNTYIAENVSDKKLVDMAEKDADGKVGTKNYWGEKIFYVEAETVEDSPQTVIIKMKKSFFNENLIRAAQNSDKPKDGNWYSDCLYVISIEPKAS